LITQQDTSKTYAHDFNISSKATVRAIPHNVCTSNRVSQLLRRAQLLWNSPGYTRQLRASRLSRADSRFDRRQQLVNIQIYETRWTCARTVGCSQPIPRTGQDHKVRDV